MMTPAEQALANAIHCEMVKCAYRQSKDGIVVSMVVHPDEVPAGLATSKLGTRYMVALVQIGDDEMPVTRKEAMPDLQRPIDPDARPQPSQPQAGAKRDWRDLQPSQQAGIRCGEPAFSTFLNEAYPEDWREVMDPAVIVRSICGIDSRAALETNHTARVIWHQLDTEYQAWLLSERVS